MILVACEPIIVSELVGRVQDNPFFKGSTFFHLAPILRNGLGLFLDEESYEPRLQSFVLPGGLGYEPETMPRRFEGLLQDIRAAFPGVGFDRLLITFKDGCMFINPL
jgi:hypothetical protein